MTLEMLKAKYGDHQNGIDTIKAKAEAEGRGDAYTAEESAALNAHMDAQDALDVQIETAKRLAIREPDDESGVSASTIRVEGLAAESEPYELGDYLQDILKVARATANGNMRSIPRVDAYQKKVKNSIKRFRNYPTGNNEGIGSEGGFLVGEDLVSGIFSRVYSNNQVISRVAQRTISTGANSMKINGIDETSRADGSRHGGVRGYWLDEGDEKTASRPKWRQMDFLLKKLAILYYATDELLADAQFLQQSVSAAVADEMAFKIQDAIINGSGAGMPLGILNSPAVVSVAKESGQLGQTIVYNNITKMWSRRWTGGNYVWLTNSDTFPELANLNLAVGTGGAPAFMPANGLAGNPYNTLMGVPLIEIEQCPTLGTVGDLMLVDLSQYMVALKGGIQEAMSIHVRFIYDETVFRWVSRIDGMPLWNSALTPYKGTATKSPFIALATRA